MNRTPIANAPVLDGLSAAERGVIWLVASGLASCGVAWVAFQLQQQGIAPAVLFPLVVGGSVGAAGAALWRLTRAPSVRRAMAAAALWGLLAVVGQDYIGHSHLLRRHDELLATGNPTLAAALSVENPLKPSLGQYLRERIAGRPWWWSLELALTAGAAVAVMARGAGPR